VWKEYLLKVGELGSNDPRRLAGLVYANLHPLEQCQRHLFLLSGPDALFLQVPTAPVKAKCSSCTAQTHTYTTPPPWGQSPRPCHRA
jgi:hypothetical protein